MNSPSPVPVLARSNSLPSRTKRPKIFRRSFGGMPDPLSAIRVSTLSGPSGWDSISTRGGDPPYLIALSIKLRKTISMSICLARTVVGSTWMRTVSGGR